MKKLLLILLVGMFMVSFASGWSETQFNNSLTEENITFNGNENYTRWLSVPKNTYLTNGILNLSGFPLAGEGTYLDTFFSNGSVTRFATPFNYKLYYTLPSSEVVFETYRDNGTNTEFNFSTAGIIDSGGTGIQPITNNGTFFWIGGDNGTIGKFYMNGTYTGDSFETLPTLTNNPSGIGVDEEYIWVTDYLLEKIYRFYINGTYSGFNFTMNELADDAETNLIVKNGFIWIGDSVNNSILKYYPNGTYVNSLNLSGLVETPAPIIMDNNKFYVMHWNASKKFYIFSDGKSVDNSGVYIENEGGLIINGKLNSTNMPQSLNLLSYINNYLSSCIPISGNCKIPFIFHSDTAGILEYASMSFSNEGFIENNISFTNQIVSGAVDDIKLNMSYDSDNFNLLAYLNYNGTNYTTTKVGTGDNILLTTPLTTPIVNTTTNYTFYWIVTLSNSTDSYTYESSRNNQTVTNLSIDNCSSNSVMLYNFTIVDETTQSKLGGASDNTRGEINIQIYNVGDGSMVQNYSASYNQTNPFAVCLNTDLSSGEQYTIDAQVRYDADSYASEYYNIQNNILNNSKFPNNITLYDLDDTNNQKFKITFKDASFLPVSGALIQIQRKYVGEGVFKTVEIPKTDAQGSTIGNFVENDVIYNLIVIKNGEILGTFKEVLVRCDNAITEECVVNLNAYSSSIQPSDFTSLTDFSYTLTYDASTREVDSMFTIPSGAASTISLNVTKFDNYGNVTVCSDSVTTSSGTLTCTIPAVYGNGTMIASLYKDGVRVGIGSMSFEDSPSTIYGSSLIFLAIFLFLTVVGIGVSDNPMITGVFLVIGGILGVSLNIIDSTGYIGKGATIIWFFILVIVLIVKGANRQ